MIGRYLTQNYDAEKQNNLYASPVARDFATKISRKHYHQHHRALSSSSSSVLFCSLAVLDPRVGHTMDILSPFISVLCHSD